MQVYISREGNYIGAWAEAEVRQFYESGHLLPTDHYWWEGMPEWQLLEGLCSAPTPALAPAIPVPPTQPANKTSPATKPPPARQWRGRSRGVPSLVNIILPVGLACVASYLIGPMSSGTSAAGQAGEMTGTVLFLCGAAFLISLIVPRSSRLAIRCGVVIGLFVLLWIGNQHQATDKTVSELNAYAAAQRQDAAQQLAQKGYVEVDPKKTDAELTKLKTLAQNESGMDKKMTDTMLEIMDQVTTRRKAVLAAEHPALALGLNPAKLTSPDALDARRAALAACQPPLKDMLNFLQNIDGTIRDSLTAKGVSSADIDSYLRGVHQSGHIEALTTYWQLESAILADYMTNLDFLKASGEKWHVDQDTVQFDDDELAATYNANVKKLQDDVKQQQAAQKDLLAAPSPQ